MWNRLHQTTIVVKRENLQSFIVETKTLKHQSCVARSLRFVSDT